jgi:3-isopropylmalate dehydrogenase
MIKIAVLPGDGIGPEVMEQALLVLNKIKQKYNLEIETRNAFVGGAGIDNCGKALPKETEEVCRWADCILFGSVGGPKWESLPADEQPERAALLPLRKKFGLYANLRPAVIYPALADASPIKNRYIKNGVDILVVRELTGGIYFGQPKKRENVEGVERAYDTLIYNEKEIERIATIAFEAAMKRNKKVCSVDKANVLTSMVLWRETINKIAKKYPEVEVEHLYIDNATMQLLVRPAEFDVLLCGNMFGDIISDEAAMITGSIGMLASASLGENNFGLYEPSGGSAPDIAGKGIANPTAQILSVAMMFKYSLNLEEAHDDIKNAVNKVLEDGYRTGDIMSDGFKLVNTKEMGQLILDRI